MLVYVLLFNAGTDNEGIHTLKIGDRNVILMFESEDDAVRYGLMLEAQDFASPTVEEIDSEEVEEFCQEAGFEYKLVAEGMLELPPESSVDELDWNSEEPKSKDDRSTADSPNPEYSSSDLDAIRRRLEGLL